MLAESKLALDQPGRPTLLNPSSRPRCSLSNTPTFRRSHSLRQQQVTPLHLNSFEGSMRQGMPLLET